MKRVFLGAAVVGMVVLTLFSLAWKTSDRPDVRAAEVRTIPLQIMSFRDNDDRKLKEGDSCSWGLGTVDIMWADPQIVVRNQDDTIVAMVSIDDGTIRLGDLAGSAFCELDMDVEVPEAEYYTVYLAKLEEVRVMGYPVDAFPVEGAPILIDPDLNGRG